jgi:hypothetical protein
MTFLMMFMRQTHLNLKNVIGIEETLQIKDNNLYYILAKLFFVNESINIKTFFLNWLFYTLIHLLENVCIH